MFEGLLPEPFNGMLLRLLYKAAEWHALAKLRLHTDSTLDLLEAVTKEFGRLMRQFRDKTSESYDTTELPCRTGSSKGGARSSKKKKLNLNTYKFHSLGDYVATIRLFGTTDSYSTQLVRSISHCTILCLTAYRENSHTASSSASMDSQTRKMPRGKLPLGIIGHTTLIRQWVMTTLTTH